MMRRIVAVVLPLGFLAYVWWAGWFLRGGPTGSHDWAFGPIITTGLALLIASVVALVHCDDGRYLP